MLCALSRAINRRITGERCTLCATAARRRWRVRHAIDLALWLYDGPDHCLRMAALDDTTGWGVSVNLPAPREGL